MRRDQPVRQQVQPQVGVVGVGGLVVQRRDHRAHGDGLDVAVLVAAGQLGQSGGTSATDSRTVPDGPSPAKLAGREPGVEDGSVGGDRRHADA